MVKSSRKIRVLEEKRKHLQLIALDTPPHPVAHHTRVHSIVIIFLSEIGGLTV